ncbi:Hect e3 ubiquitin [Globisporangium polare]
MVDFYILLIVLANVLFYVVSLVCVWLMRRRVQSLETGDAALALREALIDDTPAAEHRIDAATREAEGGYHTCAYCEFENFKRTRYCALCGEKLSTTITAAPHVSLAKVTSRKGRARRRKEWTRKIDVEGRAFWFKSATESGVSEPLFPGVVMRFNVPPSQAHSSAEDENGNGTENALVAAPQIDTEAVVMKRSSKELYTEASAAVLTLEDASAADAAVFADGTELGSQDRVREALELVTRDFPTKFAHFVVCTSSLLVPAEVEFLKLSVHRDFVVEESIEHLSCIEEKHMRSVMRINFVDESGVDAGGVHREWFMLLNELLVGPSNGLFKCTNAVDQSFFLNRNSLFDHGDDHLLYFYAVGRLVGRALLEGEALGFHLSLPLLKIILGIPVTFSDVAHLDPETYQSMQWIAENDGVDALALSFSVSELRGGEVVTVDLVPNGRNIDVTDANKRAYLERKFRYMVFESVSSQLFVFLKGLYEVIPKNLLALFDPEELDYVLCGSDEIDVTDWEKHSKHSKNLRRARALRWFWELVRDMPNEYRRRLLQFATGCSRVPLVGFKGLTSYDGRICPFTLKGVSYERSPYIRSHACFNRLDLPLYTDRSELERILYATLDTESYGFTTD